MKSSAAAASIQCGCQKSTKEWRLRWIHIFNDPPPPPQHNTLQFKPFFLSVYFLQAPKKGKGKSKGASKCERGVENKNRHTIRSSTNHHRTEVADNRETLESIRWLYSTTRTDGCEAFPFSLIFILRVPISPLLSAASQRQPTSPPLFYHTKWQMGGGRGEAEVSMMA